MYFITRDFCDNTFYIEFTTKKGSYQGIIPKKLLSTEFPEIKNEDLINIMDFWKNIQNLYLKKKKQKKAVKYNFLYNDENLLYKGYVLTLEELYKNINL